MKSNFEKKITVWTILIALIPLLLSYIVSLTLKLESMDSEIKKDLKETAFIVSNTPFIKEQLNERKVNNSIQKYTMNLVNNMQNIDIIVVADMSGVKYSHLDTNQIGHIFVNADKQKVLAEGIGYYSLMKGSMGKTLRWFEPIYHNGKQVGFVMTGRYYKELKLLSYKTVGIYLLLFLIVVIITIITSKYFAKNIKRAILGMEPEEIARVYMEKNIIINTISEGVIALNEKNKVIQINESCYKIFDNFSIEKIIKKLEYYIENKESFEIKEFILLGKKTFVTLNIMNKNKVYMGAVITIIDKNDINKIAKEITGIDQSIKNLRATVHEFKNKLHVILGLINLKEYEEAQKYILSIQESQAANSEKFSSIDDYYVKGMLISRELVANERKINLSLTPDSFLYEKHKYIDSEDLLTIIGNLIENAFEACSMSYKEDKEVELSLYEDDYLIKISVRDNGVPIAEEIKKDIFKHGISTKGLERGVGLSIIKNRVELYQGKIEIENIDKEKIFNITIYKGE